MKKETMIIIGVAVLALAFLLPSSVEKKEAGLWSGPQDLATCQSQESNFDGYACNTGCTLLDDTMASCLNGCQTINVYATGDYMRLLDPNTACSSLADTQGDVINCVAGCFGYAPSIVLDTNGDGLVSNSELLSYITLWINGQVTNNELLDAITSWVNG